MRAFVLTISLVLTAATAASASCTARTWMSIEYSRTELAWVDVLVLKVADTRASTFTGDQNAP